MRAAFLLLLPTPSLAQAEPDIVVTGRGLPPPAVDRSLGVVTIDRDRIEANAAQRLESVLAEVAGLQQFRRSDSRSANPTSQGINLRGLGGNASSRALLILDGVPQADPFGGWVAFPAYALDRLGQVRVTRGGGSGYQGPGALAGTVELDSATPDQLGGLAAHAAYGSRDSVDAGGSATLNRGAGFATMSAAYAAGDGFVPIVQEDRGPADRRAGYTQASGAIRGVIRIAPGTELQANLSAFTDRRARGTAFADTRSEGADASLRVVGRGRWGWSALAYVQTRGFASRFAAVDAARTAATLTLDQYNTPATGIGGRVEIAPPVGNAATLRLGADVRETEGRTQENYTVVAGVPTRRRVAGGTTRTAGVFADGSLGGGPVTLAIGARVDRWRIDGGFLSERAFAGGAALTDLAYPTRVGTEATGRIGAAWQVAPALTLRTAAYRGWRLPTLNELYRPFRVGADATAANPTLSPERLTGWEAGATIAPAAGLSLAATWFTNRLDDAVANVTVARGPGVFPGVGFVAAGGTYRRRDNTDIRSQGVEVDASAVRGPLTARASWSHVSARTGGLRPAQVPADQVSATLGWQRGQTGASATLRHAGRQFDDDANTRRLAAATTVDAQATLPLAPALSLELRAENLADARVEAAVTGIDTIERATPRTLWLGLRYRPR